MIGINRFIFLLIISIGIGSFYPSIAQTIYPAEIRLLNSLNPNTSNNNTPLYQIISQSVYPLAITPTLFYGTRAIITKDANDRQKCLQSMLNIGINTFITFTLKESIQRVRPYTQYPELIFNHSPSGDKSFPSGHTSFAFALATELSLEYKKWYVIAPAYLYASAVGQSRMHLGVHYPTDVVMGALVGTASAFTSKYLTKKLISKKYRKKIN